MITIMIHGDDSIEFIADKPTDEHIVVVNAKEKWTDSPNRWTTLSESEQAEMLALLRNEDYFEDRNL